MQQDKIREPTPAESQVIECMQELLKWVPQLQERFSSRTILLAFLTHASTGIRDLHAAGEYTCTEVEAICRDFCRTITTKREGEEQECLS